MNKPKIDVLDFLPFGIENALPMTELAKRMGTDQRTARQLVFKARCNGEIICSTCGENTNGYYRPNNAVELLPYITMQERRITSAKEALKSAKVLLEAETKNYGKK